MAGGVVKPCDSGRPQRQPHRLVKAYSNRQIRQYVRRHRSHGTIPRKANEHCTGPFDRASHRQRNKIERLMNPYTQFRRTATRYEKRATNYRAMWLIATIVSW
jgi:transposase